MNTRSIRAKFSVLSASLILSLAWAPAVASAADANNPNTPNNTPTATDTGNNTSQTAELNNIINRGNQEIERRLANLAKLDSLIQSSFKLTSAEQAALTSEVASAEAGLNSLKTTLDAETTVTAARTEAQSIVTEYRVYALIDPKIHLLKLADDQQAVEAKLSSLAQKLQTRINSASQSGQSVTSLSADLASMNSSISAAEAISSQVEADVFNLQPTDYNSNHGVLDGYNTQLQKAHSDIESAYTDARTIVNGLEALSNTASPSATTN